MDKETRILIAVVICTLVCYGAGPAQTPATILDIQAENGVTYFHDLWDYSKIASGPGVAVPLRPLKSFQSWTDHS